MRSAHFSDFHSFLQIFRIEVLIFAVLPSCNRPKVHVLVTAIYKLQQKLYDNHWLGIVRILNVCIDRCIHTCRCMYPCLLIREKKKLSCTLCKATGRTVTNHLGSAAFGAFLITLVRIPRYILMKINQKYVTVSAYNLTTVRISALFYMLISRQDM